MIDGFRGHLLPEGFVEDRLPRALAVTDAAPLQRDLREWRANSATLGPASSLRAMADVAGLPLATLLGLAPTGPPVARDDCVTLPLRTGHGPVLMLVAPWGASLRPCWRTAVIEAGRIGAPWCLLFNGTHLRLVRASRMYSRRYIELDLDVAVDETRTAMVLLLFFGAAALAETADPTSLRSMIAEADAYAVGVQRTLRDGVLDASRAVLCALAARERARPADDIFDQSLTIVFRLLFLLFAEARALVPVWHPVYRESYSLESLRDAAMDPQSVGLWDGLRAMTRLAHAGCRAGSLKISAFNGRLFSPARTPLAERRGLDDQAARRAIVALSTRPSADGESRDRISYRDLGVEQLGAVYETLLDYVPSIEWSRRGAPLVALQPGSGTRKATGTFYTPGALVDYLVRETLAPLVRHATPEQILARTVLDPSMGSGAFLVGACRFLGDAYETALVEHGRCHPSDIGPRERAAIRRVVAERCLFGVDINPTAVQLARLSLWLATLAADKPLTFLDHHLRVGDSLSGTWLSHLRRTPARVRAAAALPLFPDADAAAAIRNVLPTRFGLAVEPNDTAAQVRAKERALAVLASPGSPLATWTQLADAWCGAWLASPPIPVGAFTDLSDALLTGRSALPAATVRDLLRRVDDMRASRRLFHWELEFPEVFFDDSGVRRLDAGFDAVIGNPPWDMIRADGATDRTRAHVSAEVRFARDSGVFEVRTDGHLNRYQLFVDRAVALTRPGGRLGLVLPSGIVSDAGSAALRHLLFERCRVERIVGFDNRAGTFPIHRSMRFVLLTAEVGSCTRSIACRFGETDAATLEAATGDDARGATSSYTTHLTTELLRQVSGEAMSIPDIRAPVDLAILERATNLFPPVGSVDGWHAHFGRELNATDDRARMHEGVSGLPVLEGKHIIPFRALAHQTRWRVSPEAAERRLGGRWRRSRLAYRDVASATNRTTLIAALLPPRTVSTHTLFVLKEQLDLRAQRLLCGLFNSLVVNFLARMRVTTHVTTAIVERLPVPAEHHLGGWADEILPLVDQLAGAPDRAASARLNALVAAVYELREIEFSHVLDTFTLIDRSERDAMLAMFRRL